MQRLLIYSYNESNGIIGNATKFLLSEFNKVTDRMIIVCNAHLSPKGRSELKKITNDVYCLSCKNMILVVYADAIVNYCGIDKILEYDEIILMDDSVWGPLYSIENIFAEMNIKTCDYWQISNLVASQRFVVLRKTFLKRPEFLDYLKNMIYIYGKTFQDMGKIEPAVNNSIRNIYSSMVGETYISVNEMLENMSEMDIKIYLLNEKGYPFVDKEFFERSYFDLIQTINQYDIHSLIKNLQNEHSELVNLISDERALIEKSIRVSKHNLNANKIQDTLFGKLYLDYGHGFSEVNRCEGYTLIDNNGDFVIRFTPRLEGEIVRFRYDPVELIPNLIMTMYSCICDGTQVVSNYNNGKKCGDNFEFFATDDPFYTFDYKTNAINEIIIEGNIQFVNNCFRDNLNSCEITSFISNIFWNSGEGYNEKNKRTIGLFIDNDNEFEMKANLELKEICGLRLDPIEGFKCKLHMYDLLINGHKVGVKGTNGIIIGKNKFVFNTFDPAIELKIKEKNIESIYVRGKIEIM